MNNKIGMRLFYFKLFLVVFRVEKLPRESKGNSYNDSGKDLSLIMVSQVYSTNGDYKHTHKESHPQKPIDQIANYKVILKHV